MSPLFLVLLAAAVAGGALAAVGPRTTTAITAGIVVLVLAGWAVSLCLHEFGHAALAYRYGDYSVRAKGYLTLDIRRYTDPVLSFVLPLVFLLAGGIPLPGGAVWINTGAVRSRAALSLISLAGPVTNLVLGVALVVAVTLTGPPVGLLVGLSYLAFVQIIAFLLNILPVPGLDGFGVLEPYLGLPARQLAARVRPWAPIVLFLLIIGLPGINRLFFDATFALYGLVGGNEQAAVLGQYTFLFWRH